ncbi:MAG: DUF3341 domain-containing protein [Deltaproteobacteria bacterium]|nr:DUF3341 domain-containing protein [Deltaproteobacteria bacterium]
MPADKYVLGLFTSEDKTVSAMQAMSEAPWQIERVHSPIPSERILDSLAVKKSRLGYFTLAGGIVGFFAGLALAVFTATRWHLIVWGKPVVAWIPFFIVGFEFTILFSVLANVLGLIMLSDLPDLNWSEHYDPRCSGDHFGILARCPDGRQQELAEFFRTQGGEPRLFEEN